MEPSSGNKPASTMMVVVAFAIVYIVWGSTYFFYPPVGRAYPAHVAGALRFVTAGVLMLLWCLARGERLFVWKNMRPALISGLLLLFFGNGALYLVRAIPGQFPCRDLTGCRADLVRPAGQTQLA